jgi:DNA-binding MarR family transcriptional regulator
MGYVNRIHDINDRRKIYISASKEGKKVASRINNAVNKQINNHLSKLNQEELEALESGLLILKKLCADCNSKDVG